MVFSKHYLGSTHSREKRKQKWLKKIKEFFSHRNELQNMDFSSKTKALI